MANTEPTEPTEVKQIEEQFNKLAGVEPTVKESLPVAENKQEPEQTDVEKQAAAKGWKPSGKKSAQQFLDDEPLYEEIKARGKEIKDLKKKLEGVTSFVERQQQREMETLVQARKQAIKKGDVETVEELEHEMNEINTPAPPVELHPAAQAFVDKYAFLNKDHTLKAEKVKSFILSRDQELGKHQLNPEEHIRVLERDLLDEFSSFFEPEKKVVKAQAVESDGDFGFDKPKTKKLTYNDLSPEEKSCGKHFVDMKVFKSMSDYITSLENLSGRK